MVVSDVEVLKWIVRKVAVGIIAVSSKNRSVAFVETSGCTFIENGVDPVGATEEAVGPVGIVETLQGGGNLEAGTHSLFPRCYDP